MFSLSFDYPKNNSKGFLIECSSLNKIVCLCSLPKATEITRVRNQQRYKSAKRKGVRQYTLVDEKSQEILGKWKPNKCRRVQKTNVNVYKEEKPTRNEDTLQIPEKLINGKHHLLLRVKVA